MDHNKSSFIDWDTVWETLDWTAGSHRQTAEATLAERARRYAQPIADAAQPDSETLTVLAFERGNSHYALPVQAVMRSLGAPRITPVPCTPLYYLGVVNVRGRILTAFDLPAFWGVAQDDLGTPPRLIVANAAGLEIAIGADEILGLQDILATSIVPPTLAGVQLSHVQGISPDGTIILDVESLFKDKRLTVHEEL